MALPIVSLGGFRELIEVMREMELADPQAERFHQEALQPQAREENKAERAAEAAAKRQTNEKNHLSWTLWKKK
ncbi:hypothetical protein K3495_g6943 [Podosphaera aphanis]|nr:hypothetical protein K3495_g6943 [Podosphaera aphanis]